MDGCDRSAKAALEKVGVTDTKMSHFFKKSTILCYKKGQKGKCYYYYFLLRLHLNKSLIPAYFLSGNPTGSYSVVAGRTCYIRYGNVYEIRI